MTPLRLFRSILETKMFQPSDYKYDCKYHGTILPKSYMAECAKILESHDVLPASYRNDVDTPDLLLDIFQILVRSGQLKLLELFLNNIFQDELYKSVPNEYIELGWLHKQHRKLYIGRRLYLRGINQSDLRSIIICLFAHYTRHITIKVLGKYELYQIRNYITTEHSSGGLYIGKYNIQDRNTFLTDDRIKKIKNKFKAIIKKRQDTFLYSQQRR